MNCVRVMSRMIVCLLLGGAGSIFAAPVVDQVLDPREPAPGEGVLAVMYRGGYFAQTFEVGRTGTLTGVDILLSRRESMQLDMLFDLTPTTDGVPAATLGPPSLAVIPSSAIPVVPDFHFETADWVHVDVSAYNMLVDEGTVLAIVLKLKTGGFVPADPEHMYDALWIGMSNDPYPEGASFAHPAVAGASWTALGSGGSAPDLGFRTWVEELLTVPIAVKPGSDLGSINPESRGTVPVGILGTVDFDAAQVDPSSVLVGGAPLRALPKGAQASQLEDVNRDGLMDLVVHVATSDLDLAGPVAEIIVTGATYDGTRFRGLDHVKVVQ
jgi:hypothetical protein